MEYRFIIRLESQSSVDAKKKASLVRKSMLANPAITAVAEPQVSNFNSELTIMIDFCHNMTRFS